jgi:N-acetyl-anhydromuramyl-L-alanine amidase AmpD
VLGSEVGVNGFSLGIEIEHAAGSGAYPEAQLQALRALLQEKRAAYHIPLERIVSHRAVATPKGRKGDPSDWPEEALRAWLVGLGG